MTVLTCPHCSYTWQPRKKQPKKCPSCIRWLVDHPAGDKRGFGPKTGLHVIETAREARR